MPVEYRRIRDKSVTLAAAEVHSQKPRVSDLKHDDNECGGRDGRAELRGWQAHSSKEAGVEPEPYRITKPAMQRHPSSGAAWGTAGPAAQQSRARAQYAFGFLTFSS